MVPDERAFLQKLSHSAPEVLLQAALGADEQEERVLRIYLGNAQYEEILRIASTARAVRGPADKLGNVVVLHGIMGGELTRFDSGDSQSLIWVQMLRLLQGQFDQLALNSEGLSVHDVRPSGIYLRFYGSQVARLSQDWNVRPYFYDWRQDIRLAADSLFQNINSWFGPEAPVHVIGHSMGGLVARSYIQRHAERWNKADNAGKRARLVMLGTPNYGSLAITRMLLGTNDVLNLVAKMDLSHSRRDLLNIAKTFVGAYQMLPVRGKLDGLDVIYKAATYDVVPIDQSLLDQAEAFQAEIKSVVDPERMTYVAGYNRPTLAAIQDPTQLGNDRGYFFSRKGDGTVPHDLGLLPNVKTFYVDDEHQNLPANTKVQSAMTELLQTGDQQTEQYLYKALGPEFATERGAAGENQPALLATESARKAAKEQQVAKLRTLLSTRGAFDSDRVSAEEYQLADALLRYDALTPSTGTTASGSGPMAAADAASASAATGASPVATQDGTRGSSANLSQEEALPHTTIRVHVLVGKIEEIALTSAANEKRPIDCMAVGHYLRVKPTGAERDLDRAISQQAQPAAPAGQPAPKVQDNTEESDENLLLSQFHERGILRGDLGVPFYLPDPRATHAGNLLVIAGMGPAGGFGLPELTFLVRDVTWSLGQIGKKHLATVLIGASKKNLSIPDAIHGWLLGLNRALVSAAACPAKCLEAITFLICTQPHSTPSTASSGTSPSTSPTDSDALPLVVSTLKSEARMMQSGSLFNFDIQLIDMPPVATPVLASVQTSAATRISIEFEEGMCRYSAMTEGASVAERIYHINPKRITDINSRLLTTDDPLQKCKLGQFLLDYLFPTDLRQSLTGSAPIVLTCNTQAAQVYWELAAQPVGYEEVGAPADLPYLGLARGLTRQLKTVLAPAPESAPPLGRVLRVLLVADTCKEHPLLGAHDEAELLQTLFTRINASGSKNKIMVTSLIGPSKATTLDVLLGINNYPPFDILHYAGHCVYDADHPELSGFLFSDDDRLTANDLNRIDRTPKLVFANACESGILPSRRDLSSPALPATFAEAFFQKGVANFICTAWPIGDDAARDFANEFYRYLLGDGMAPTPMFEAIRKARQKIAGTQTWAAYQHYGSPYSRVFRSR